MIYLERATLDRVLPVEPQRVLGRNLAIPFHFYFHLHYHGRHPTPPPPPLPLPPSRPTGSFPGLSQPGSGSPLRHHIHRNPPLIHRRNTRHQVVLAAVQNAIPVAALLPPRHPPLRPRVLLVIHFLPLPLHPHLKDFLHNPKKPPQFPIFPALQPLDSHRHDVSMAWIHSVFPSPRHSFHDFDVLTGLWVSILHRDRITEKLFPFLDVLPNCFGGNDFGLAYRSSGFAFLERRVQWYGSMGVQLCA